jgi:hypothetical protein
MKRFVCHYCGCDALEPEPYDFVYTCLVCLRRHSGLLALREVIHSNFLKASDVYVLALNDWVMR